MVPTPVIPAGSVSPRRVGGIMHPGMLWWWKHARRRHGCGEGAGAWDQSGEGEGWTPGRLAGRPGALLGDGAARGHPCFASYLSTSFSYLPAAMRESATDLISSSLLRPVPARRLARMRRRASE